MSIYMQIFKEVLHLLLTLPFLMNEACVCENLFFQLEKKKKNSPFIPDLIINIHVIDSIKDQKTIFFSKKAFWVTTPIFNYFENTSRVSLFIPQLKIKQIAVDRLLHFGHYVWHKGGKVDKTDIVLHLTKISV